MEETRPEKYRHPATPCQQRILAMPLTDTMLRNLKSDGTPAKLADSEGLYLYLSASGGKL